MSAMVCLRGYQLQQLRDEGIMLSRQRFLGAFAHGLLQS